MFAAKNAAVLTKGYLEDRIRIDDTIIKACMRGEFFCNIVFTEPIRESIFKELQTLGYKISIHENHINGYFMELKWNNL